MMRRLLPVLGWLVAVVVESGADFVATNVLPDGEVEVRIKYRGITAKETTVSSRSDTKITLRQLTDGKRFIQLIYDAKEIRDCEYLHQKGQVEKFLSTFEDGLETSSATSNFTMKSFDVLPRRYRGWLNYGKLRKMCRRSHATVRKALKETSRRENETTVSRSRAPRAISDYLIAPGTYWCGYDDIAASYTSLGGMSITDRCCRKHDHCKMNIHGFTQKFNYYNMKPFTISHCWCDNRRRRDISEIFHIPGTEWCGKGFSAKKYTHLGGFSRTDRCCRMHDTACPFWIGAFEHKYGLFNWRVNTLMHCSCDDRFRACLKMADTSDANLVGKLFFNVVQTKCFVLKPKKMCMRRSWWGKCTKKKIIKQAVLRDNLAY